MGRHYVISVMHACMHAWHFLSAVICIPSLQVMTLLGSVAKFSDSSSSSAVVAHGIHVDAMTKFVGMLNSARAFLILDFSQLPEIWVRMMPLIMAYDAFDSWN